MTGRVARGPLPKKLLSFLNLRQGEGTLTGAGFLLSFLLGVPQLFTGAAAGALFLETHRAADLPLIYVATSVFIPALGLFILRTPARGLGGLAPLFVLPPAATAALYALLRLLPAVDPVKALLLIWAEAEVVLTEMAFWIIVNRLFDVRQAKRLFALMSSGNVAASVLGGLLVPALLAHVGTAGLLLVSLVGQGGAFLCFALLRSRAGERAPPADSLAEGDMPVRDEPSEQGMRLGRGSISGFLRDSYVRAIFVLVICEFIAHYFIDNAFFDRMETGLEGSEMIAGFIGKFLAAAGGIQLLVKVLVAGRFLDRVGIRGGVLGAPLITGAAAVAVAVAGVLGTGPQAALYLTAFLRLAKSVYVNSVYAPAFYTLFRPLPPGQRTGAQKLADTVVSQVAGGVAGLILLGAGRLFRLDAFGIAWMVSAVCLGWLYAGIRLHRGYQRALSSSLEKKGLVRTDYIARETRARDILRRSIENGPPPEAAAAREILDRYFGQDSGAVRHSDARSSSVSLSGLEGMADRSARHRRLVELRSAGYESPEDHPGIDPIIEEETAFVHRVLCISRDLRDQDVPLLLRALDYEGRKALERIFLALSFQYPPDEIADIWNNLDSTSQERKSFALETFDTLVSGRAKAIVLPLVDTLSPDDRLALLARRGLCPGVPVAERLGMLASGSGEWAGSWTELCARLYLDTVSEPTRELVRRVAILRRAEVLSGVAEEDLARLAEGLAARTYAPGERIIRKGETGSSLFVLSAGSVRVHDGDVVYAVLTAGDIVGEFSALDPEPRSATVTAEAPTHVLEAGNDLLEAFIRERLPAARAILGVLVARQRSMLKRASPVGRERGLLGAAGAAREPQTADRELGLLEKVLVLKSAEVFRPTPDDILAGAAAAAGVVIRQAGEPVYAEGDRRTGLYVVMSGLVRIECGGREVYRIQEREVFGEPGVVDFLPHAGTAVAQSATTLLRIPRKTLHALLWDQFDVIRGLILVTINRIRRLNALGLRA